MLPVSSFFTAKVLHCKTVYGHFRKWCKKGEWQTVWTTLLNRYKSFLDMSSIDLDGNHTTTLCGGDCQSYQGRKKQKTTNAIYVTDRQGIPLAISSPVAGSHNDLYNIQKWVKKCSHNSQSLIFLLMDYFSMLIPDSMQKSLGTCA